MPWTGAGGVPRASVVGVLLLRCGSRRTQVGNPNPNPDPDPNLNPNPNPNPNPSPNPNQLLTLLRGLTGTGGIGLLNLAYFNFLTFADACTPNPSSKPYP